MDEVDILILDNSSKLISSKYRFDDHDPYRYFVKFTYAISNLVKFKRKDNSDHHSE